MRQQVFSSPPATAQAVCFVINPAIFRRLLCTRYATSAESYFVIDLLRSVAEGVSPKVVR
jgi:hypothetical protein